MNAIDRRRFLGLLMTMPFLTAFRRGDASTVIEAEEASVFYAPHLADRLVAGTPLAVVERVAGSYLAFGDHLVARLPDRVARAGTTVSCSVSALARDEYGRLRLFVSMSGKGA